MLPCTATACRCRRRAALHPRTDEAAEKVHGAGLPVSRSRPSMSPAVAAYLRPHRGSAGMSPREETVPKARICNGQLTIPLSDETRDKARGRRRDRSAGIPGWRRAASGIGRNPGADLERICAITDQVLPRSGGSRRETMQAQMDIRLDRIEKKLNLTHA
jgi:hypothetical protein